MRPKSTIERALGAGWVVVDTDRLEHNHKHIHSQPCHLNTNALTGENCAFHQNTVMVYQYKFRLEILSLVSTWKLFYAPMSTLRVVGGQLTAAVTRLTIVIASGQPLSVQTGTRTCVSSARLSCHISTNLSLHTAGGF